MLTETISISFIKMGQSILLFLGIILLLPASLSYYFRKHKHFFFSFGRNQLLCVG